MKKKILIFSLMFLFLSLIAGFYYANAVILPTVLKNKIISSFSEATGTRVTLESVRIHLLRGIVLTGLVIPDKADTANPLLRIQNGSVSLLILPLLKEKSVIISSVRIDKADARLIRQKDNSWNISPFFQKPELASGAPMAFPLIKNIDIRALTITLLDNVPDAPQTYTLRIKNITAAASLSTITARGQGELECDGNAFPLEMQGKYTFPDGFATAQIKAAGLDVALLKKALGQGPWSGLPDRGALGRIEADITISQDSFDVVLDVDMAGIAASKDKISVQDASARARVNLTAAKDDLKNFTASGTLDIAGASVAYQDKTTFQTGLGASLITFTYDKNTLSIDANLTLKDASGAFEAVSVSGLNAEVKCDLSLPFTQSPEKTDARAAPVYNGSGKIASAVVDGIPTVKKITVADASFVFDNDGITVDKTAIGIFNTVATANGRYTATSVEADMQGEFDLSDIAAFIPEAANLPPYAISGAADIQARISTSLPPPAGLPEISGEALFKDVWLRLKDKPFTFTTNKGRLTFNTSREILEWHDEAILVNDEASYSFDGKLNGFDTPTINAILIGPDLKIKTQFTKNKNKLAVASFKGQFRKSGADLSGSFDLDGQKLDVTGKIALNLSDIPSRAVSLQGLCELNVSCQGPLKNMRQWTIKGSGFSDLIRGYGYKATNIRLTYEQTGGIGLIDELTFEAYGGQGFVKGRLDVTGDVISYALRGMIDNLDLAALKLDAPIKDVALYGTMGLKIAFQGVGNDTQTLKGGGHVTIVNGNIWEFNPLKELGTFLFAPRFGKLAFTTAQGDFFIRDNAVTSDNMELLGPELSLLIEGKVGFDGTLDLLVNSQVPLPGPAQKLAETKIGEAVTKAGSLTAIEVKGTMQKPKYKLLPIRANIVKRISDVVSNILP